MPKCLFLGKFFSKNQPMNRNLVFYIVTILIFGGLMYAVTQLGLDLEGSNVAAPVTQSGSAFDLFKKVFMKALFIHSQP